MQGATFSSSSSHLAPASSAAGSSATVSDATVSDATVSDTPVSDTAVSDAEFVARVGVQWQRRPLAPEPGLAQLLAQPQLDDGGKATVVQAVGALVVDECVAHGYHSMDLVVLHPGTPGLQEALERFDKPHTHADDEVRYILDGEGLFGFFDATGQERVLRVGPGDYLRIPAGVEHRFTLTAGRRIKALRLFADTAGWVAQYTQRAAAAMQVSA